MQRDKHTGQVFQATVRRAITKLIKEFDIPVPDGHARRRKGWTHRFAKAKDFGPVVRKLHELLECEPKMSCKPWQVPLLSFRPTNLKDGWKVVVWLPDGNDYFVVSM